MEIPFSFHDAAKARFARSFDCSMTLRSGAASSGNSIADASGAMPRDRFDYIGFHQGGMLTTRHRRLATPAPLAQLNRLNSYEA
jgi:hypothetical protein